MKRSIILILALVLTTLVFTGCRRRNNQPTTEATTMPTTMPTTAPTTAPTTRPTTQPTTQATEPSTDETMNDGIDPTGDTGAGENGMNDDARRGMPRGF